MFGFDELNDAFAKIHIVSTKIDQTDIGRDIYIHEDPQFPNNVDIIQMLH